MKSAHAFHVRQTLGGNAAEPLGKLQNALNPANECTERREGGAALRAG